MMNNFFNMTCSLDCVSGTPQYANSEDISDSLAVCSKFLGKRGFGRMVCMFQEEAIKNSLEDMLEDIKKKSPGIIVRASYLIVQKKPSIAISWVNSAFLSEVHNLSDAEFEDYVLDKLEEIAYENPQELAKQHGIDVLVRALNRIKRVNLSEGAQYRIILLFILAFLEWKFVLLYILFMMAQLIFKLHDDSANL